ncbi:hypothetical protein, partial [Hyphomicrobium sp.]|uniref:hypothetical protein n=1 Tax=Hyphomicrobium sp. TaxID=82 RepID=UPI003F70C29B
ALSVAQGGSFMEGFASAGLGSVGGFAGEGIAGGGPDGFYVRTAFAASAGGLASEITGGKFSNGAITAGFAHMFNAEAHRERGAPGTQSGTDLRAFEGRGIQQSYIFEEAALILAPFVRGFYLIAPGGLAADAKFAQATFSRMFSQGGTFAGKSVDDVAAALRSGATKASDVPVNYIVRDGQTIILNTRSAQALEAAGIPRAQWNGVNQTGNSFFENLLNGQLGRNPGAPFSTVRPGGQ